MTNTIGFCTGCWALTGTAVGVGVGIPVGVAVGDAPGEAVGVGVAALAVTTIVAEAAADNKTFSLVPSTSLIDKTCVLSEVVSKVTFDPEEPVAAMAFNCRVAIAVSFAIALAGSAPIDKEIEAVPLLS